ncbi:MAG: NAD(P)/FAD-dependent oxidoreductase [Candidatus Heimdallarchaeota archaeon]|nr:MAG: NAD(P)/FAD-dependent oxidoreductase [Candidatus Heimdallarchaeota archaeon]
MKYVVIGNGVAGVSAIQVLSKEKPSNSTVLQFTDEPFPGFYNRPKIPAFIEKNEMTIEDTIAYNLDWYKKLDVDLHIQEKVEKINFEMNEVLSNKAAYPFDRLLIATGGDCWCPPIEGRHLKHFYSVRSLNDALEIRKRFKISKKAIIIGGGVLGLEIANAATNQGQNTTVIEFFPHLLPRQLDEEGGNILKRILEKRGITIHVNKEVQRVIGEEEVQAVITKDGVEISTDIVMVCTGIKPRVDLGRDFLEINRGIIVNDYLETSQEDIFAAGDCAEHNGIVYGLIPPSIQQARIAAHNMINMDTRYKGSKISSTLKVTDLFLSSFGYTGKESELGYGVRKYINEEEYVKLFIHNDKIKAAIILGVKKAIPTIKTIFTEEKSVSDHETKIKEVLPELS